MNVFVIAPTCSESAELLAKHDPVRARKQLIECAQILACVDHLVDGKTEMLKADGKPYGAAHPHHPITKLCVDLGAMYRITYLLAFDLSHYFPEHATSKTIRAFRPKEIKRLDSRYICCRSGLAPLIVHSKIEYGHIMREYMRERKGFPV